ncbi:E3 ubiquitin ligase TRIM40 isoform X1 [Marmota marmota marmota]|uniref:E3 ubiquitin ligase TRIM40 isoform X1 n=1 Tax=Marmota marmota marmota TaxID=9994 RepID=UPI0020932DB8|nr:E3 ubiquitin ligase TRIM40 isoform X1 [Marmota marmota marmota]XP_048662001.1 E3 ubiquitin ligase TRIM40 isoform X1 [Marmota marmota marmota]XP_048662002.1 E3 ubiquitin ligase TRIM40 isoform X1 [Marmota marmota marmota]
MVSLQEDRQEEAVCPICQEHLKEAVSTDCKHLFCRVCLAQHMEKALASGALCCPLCRKPYSERVLGEGYICHKHQKRFQRFCEKSKCLLCVECLESPEHQSHSEPTIENAISHYKLCHRFCMAPEMSDPAGATQPHNLSEMGVACQEANQPIDCKPSRSKTPQAETLSLPLMYSLLNKEPEPFSSHSVLAPTGTGGPLRSSPFLNPLSGSGSYFFTNYSRLSFSQVVHHLLSRKLSWQDAGCRGVVNVCRNLLFKLKQVANLYDILSLNIILLQK